MLRALLLPAPCSLLRAPYYPVNRERARESKSVVEGGEAWGRGVELRAPEGRLDAAGDVLVPARRRTAAVRATASVIRCTSPSAPVSSVAGANTANSAGPVRHTASEIRPARLTASASRSALPVVSTPSAG